MISLIVYIAIPCLADEPPKAKANSLELGSLSRKYEVGKGGPETISSGKGDRGGISYGLYQLNSRTVMSFVAKHYPDEFNGLKSGTPEFAEKWKAIAKADPDKFSQVQHDYIKATHYDPVVNGLKSNLKLDAEARSNALQQVIWSTGVHHGAAGAQRIVKTALAKDLKDDSAAHLSDEHIIRAIYAERGRTNDKGGLVHFQGNSEAVQKAVANRFVSELRDALQLLEAKK